MPHYCDVAAVRDCGGESANAIREVCICVGAVNAGKSPSRVRRVRRWICFVCQIVCLDVLGCAMSEEMFFTLRSNAKVHMCLGLLVCAHAVRIYCYYLVVRTLCRLCACVSVCLCVPMSAWCACV